MLPSAFSSHFIEDAVEYSVLNVWALYDFALVQDFVSWVAAPFLPMKPRGSRMSHSWALVDVLGLGRLFDQSRRFFLSDHLFFKHLRVVIGFSNLYRLSVFIFLMVGIFIIDW